VFRPHKYLVSFTHIASLPLSSNNTGAGGPRNAGSHMLLRQQPRSEQQQQQHGTSGRYSGGQGSRSFASRPVVERGSSPIEIDPTTQIPINVPPQDRFWYVVRLKKICTLPSTCIVQVRSVAKQISCKTNKLFQHNAFL